MKYCAAGFFLFGVTFKQNPQFCVDLINSLNRLGIIWEKKYIPKGCIYTIFMHWWITVWKSRMFLSNQFCIPMNYSKWKYSFLCQLINVKFTMNNVIITLISWYYILLHLSIKVNIFPFFSFFLNLSNLKTIVGLKVTNLNIT